MASYIHLEEPPLSQAQREPCSPYYPASSREATPNVHRPGGSRHALALQTAQPDPAGPSTRRPSQVPSPDAIVTLPLLQRPAGNPEAQSSRPPVDLKCLGKLKAQAEERGQKIAVPSRKPDPRAPAFYPRPRHLRLSPPGPWNPQGTPASLLPAGVGPNAVRPGQEEDPTTRRALRPVLPPSGVDPGALGIGPDCLNQAAGKRAGPPAARVAVPAETPDARRLPCHPRPGQMPIVPDNFRGTASSTGREVGTARTRSAARTLRGSYEERLMLFAYGERIKDPAFRAEVLARLEVVKLELELAAFKAMAIPELVAIICSFLGKSDLSSCCRVNRLWFEESTSCLWEVVTSLTDPYPISFPSPFPSMGQLAAVGQGEGGAERLQIYASKVRVIDGQDFVVPAEVDEVDPFAELQRAATRFRGTLCDWPYQLFGEIFLEVRFNNLESIDVPHFASRERYSVGTLPYMGTNLKHFSFRNGNFGIGFFDLLKMNSTTLKSLELHLCGTQFIDKLIEFMRDMPTLENLVIEGNSGNQMADTMWTEEIFFEASKLRRLKSLAGGHIEPSWTESVRITRAETVTKPFPALEGFRAQLPGDGFKSLLPLLQGVRQLDLLFRGTSFGAIASILKLPKLEAFAVRNPHEQPPSWSVLTDQLAPSLRDPSFLGRHKLVTARMRKKQCIFEMNEFLELRSYGLDSHRGWSIEGHRTGHRSEQSGEPICACDQPEEEEPLGLEMLLGCSHVGRAPFLRDEQRLAYEYGLGGLWWALASASGPDEPKFVAAHKRLSRITVHVANRWNEWIDRNPPRFVAWIDGPPDAGEVSLGAARFELQKRAARRRNTVDALGGRAQSGSGKVGRSWAQQTRTLLESPKLFPQRRRE